MILKHALILSSLAGLTLLVAAPAAYADTVTDTGSTYTLTSSSDGPDSYQFVLTIDTSGYAPADGTDLLNAVAINVLKSSASYTGFSVVSAPAGYAATLQNGGLGAGGCNNNASNFLCLAFSPTPGGEPVGASGDVYTFIFDIDVSSGGLKNMTDVKAVYDTSGSRANGANTDVYTESIAATPTPEPSSLVLLGTGVLGIAGSLRRRFRA